ncbi:MAG: LLM class flavin-dependent oxidoreductase [Acidimicrobiales bacterium]
MKLGVGLWCLQSSALRPRPFPALYEELLEDARRAESVGLDSLWLSEHHYFYDGYCPALLPAAAAALAVTKRLRVGTGVLLLPLQRAARVVAAAEDLSRSSGGRFDLGVGAGYREIEYSGKGLRFEDRLARMRSGLDALGGVSSPVWVGVSTPAAARRAGRRNLGLFLSGAFPPSVVQQLIEEHRTAWHGAGAVGGQPPPVGLLRNVWLADTPAERDRAVHWARSSYVVYAGLGWTASDAGMDFTAGVEASMDEVARGAIIGGAEDVAEELRRFHGVDTVVCRIGYDLPPRSAIVEVLERIGTELRPLLDTP